MRLVNDSFTSRVYKSIKSTKYGIREGYSLGDDKESFDKFEELNKKLKDIIDFIKSYKSKDLDYAIQNVEHSQDNIYYADIMLTGLKEEDIEKEDELNNSILDRFPFISNIQISKWYDDVICFIGFDIEATSGRHKSDLVVVIRRVLEALGIDKLNESAVSEEDLYTTGKYKIVIKTEIAKGSVELDGEDTYRTANARPIDEIVREYYTNALPTNDDRWRECVERGWNIMAYPFIPHHITCYSDESCSSSVGMLDEVADKQWSEASTKYSDDYWRGVSYDIRQSVKIFDMEGNQVVGLKNKSAE